MLQRERPNVTRTGLTHKMIILWAPEEGQPPEEVTLFITANTFPDGRLCEIFLTPQKEGSTIAGLLDCISTLTSMLLQSGWPLSKLVEKFGHTKFEPSGPTKGDTPIRFAKSIVDYVFRWLGCTFLPPDDPNYPKPEGKVAAYPKVDFTPTVPITEMAG